MATETSNLKLRYIQPTDYFISDTFNTILDDIDSKVVGKSHLDTGAHWDIWKSSSAYSKGDIMRTKYLKSNQYLECTVAGTTGTTEPRVNVDGTQYNDGTSTWIVRTLGATNESTISIWLSGEVYTRGALVLYNQALYRSKVAHTSTTFSADYANWQEVYASIKLWKSGTYYAVDDTVVKDNLLYKCKTANSDVVFTLSNWDIVGAISIIANWSQSTDYKENQVVVYNSKLYRSKSNHKSSTAFNPSDYEEIHAVVPKWSSSTSYNIGDVINYDNTLYECIVAHTSSASFSSDRATNWKLYNVHDSFILDWKANTTYEKYQVAKKGSTIYRCVNKNTDATFTSANWEIISYIISNWAASETYGVGQYVFHDKCIYECITANNDATFTEAKWKMITYVIKDWTASDYYRVGEYINYNQSLYKCKTANSDTTFTIANWEKVGSKGIEDWSTGIAYLSGDMVVESNKLYKCLVSHTSGTFSTDFKAGKWQEISACITHIDDWKASTDYIVGDLVANDKKIYRCITSNTSSSSFDTDKAKWEELSPTINEISIWTTGKAYAIGDLVINDNRLYRCITANTSSSSFDTDKAKWQLIGTSGGASDWAKSTTYYKDQFVEVNGVLYRATSDHISSSVDFKSDDTKWELVYANIQPYTNKTYYKLGSIVESNAKLYKCIKSHTSNNIDTTSVIIEDTSLAQSGHSIVIDLNSEFILDYIDVNYNNISDFAVEVSDDGATYVSVGSPTGLPVGANTERITIHKLISARYVKITAGASQGSNSAIISTNVYTDMIHYWEELGISNAYVPNWSSSVHYYKNCVVVNGEKSYRCTKEHISEQTFSNDYWEEFSPTVLSNWEIKKHYFKNQLVLHEHILYRATEEHTSGTTFDSTHLERVTIGYLALWESSKYYVVGECVTINSTIIRCIATHTSGATYDLAESNNWNVVASAKAIIAKWESGATYTSGTVVTNGDIIYICSENHTASTDFETDITKWVVANSGIAEWKTDTGYAQNAVVTNHNKLYRCIVGHTSSLTKFSDDISKWKEISYGTYEWKTSEKYYVDDLVIYDGRFYIAVADHTSSAKFSSDFADWKLVNIITDWTSNNFYSVGSYVLHNGILHKCLIKHTSDTSDFYADYNKNYWEKIDSITDIDEWEVSTVYYKNQLIKKDNIVYMSKAYHKSNATDFNADYANWEIVSTSLPVWSSSTEYINGTVVINNNKLYRCISSHKSSSSFKSDMSKWNIIISDVISNWRANTDYYDDEEVLYDNVLYRCNTIHTSSATFDLDVNKWDIVYSNLRDYATGTFYKAGSIVRYNNDLYVCNTSHTSNGSDILNNKIYDGSGYLHNDKMGGTVVKTHTFDLGSISRITSVNLLASCVAGYSANSYIGEIDIEFSTDNVTFTHTIKLTNITSSGWLYNDIIILARYVRISMSGEYIASGNGSGWSGSVGVSTVTVIGDRYYWDKIGTYNKPLVWEKYVTYNVDDIIVSGTKVYKCITQHTSGDKFSDNADDWVELSKADISLWKPSTTYSINDDVIYNGDIYKCTVAHTSSLSFVTDVSKWAMVGGSSINLWASGNSYSVGNLVIYGNKLYRCITANSDTLFTDSKWNIISFEGITEWVSGKSYNLHDMVVSGSSAYICTNAHISTTSITNDIANWMSLSGGGGSAGSGYIQVNKLGVVAPMSVDIPVDKTTTFNLPPVEVLKLASGESNVVKNQFTFSSGDGSSFTVDGKPANTSDYVIFDGAVHQNHNYKYSLGATVQMSSGYYSESDTINLSNFKVIDSVVLA